MSETLLVHDYPLPMRQTIQEFSLVGYPVARVYESALSLPLVVAVVPFINYTILESILALSVFEAIFELSLINSVGLRKPASPVKFSLFTKLALVCIVFFSLTPLEPTERLESFDVLS